MPTGLSELVLIVDDVPAGVRFYRDLIGLTLEKPASDDWAWFLLDTAGPTQRLALATGPLLFEEHSPKPAGERFGTVHFAIEVTPDEWDQIRSRLEAAGVEVFGPTHFDWMAATGHYCYDPAGNLLELWIPDAATP